MRTADQTSFETQLASINRALSARNQPELIASGAGTRLVCARERVRQRADLQQKCVKLGLELGKSRRWFNCQLIQIEPARDFHLDDMDVLRRSPMMRRYISPGIGAIASD